MSATVRCPSCGSQLSGADRFAGKRVRCPKCKAAIDIPREHAPASATGPPPLPPTVTTGREEYTGEAIDSESATSAEATSPPPLPSPSQTDHPATDETHASVLTTAPDVNSILPADSKVDSTFSDGESGPASASPTVATPPPVPADPTSPRTSWAPLLVGAIALLVVTVGMVVWYTMFRDGAVVAQVSGDDPPATISDTPSGSLALDTNVAYPKTGAPPVRSPWKPNDAKTNADWERFQKSLETISPDDFLRTIEKKEAPDAFVDRFLVPWYVELGNTDQAYQCVPGGQLYDSIWATWVEIRANGPATVTPPVFAPAWPATTARGMSGWLRNTEGKNVNFIATNCLINIPTTQPVGTQTLIIRLNADGPPDEKGNGKFTVEEKYQLRIEAWPTPDRAALLCFWAFTLRRGKELAETKNQTAAETQQLLWCRQVFEKGFRQVGDPKLAAFHDELLNHSEYRKLVSK